MTCLNVQGNRAVVGWFGAFPVLGAAVLVRFSGLAEIVDNGSPGVGKDTFQISEITTFPNDRPAEDIPITNCPASLPGEGQPLPQLPAPFGNSDFVVTDAPALPTSKDQCKNGGWRNFAGFKNEGDCVSFVATGGKNQRS